MSTLKQNKKNHEQSCNKELALSCNIDSRLKEADHYQKSIDEEFSAFILEYETSQYQSSVFDQSSSPRKPKIPRSQYLQGEPTNQCRCQCHNKRPELIQASHKMKKVQEQIEQLALYRSQTKTNLEILSEHFKAMFSLISENIYKEIQRQHTKNQQKMSKLEQKIKELQRSNEYYQQMIHSPKQNQTFIGEKNSDKYKCQQNIRKVRRHQKTPSFPCEQQMNKQNDKKERNKSTNRISNAHNLYEQINSRNKQFQSLRQRIMRLRNQIKLENGSLKSIPHRN